MHALDAHDEIVERCVVRNVARQTGFGAREDFPFLFLDAEPDDPHDRSVTAERADDRQALSRRHIDDRDVGVRVRGEGNRLIDIRRGADHEKVRPQ